MDLLEARAMEFSRRDRGEASVSGEAPARPYAIRGGHLTEIKGGQEGRPCGGARSALGWARSR